MKIKAPNITPGNWHVEDTIVTSSSGEVIASCEQRMIIEEENQINAQAIAALPQLLRALEMALFFVDKEGSAFGPIKLALEKAGYNIEL